MSDLLYAHHVLAYLEWLAGAAVRIEANQAAQLGLLKQITTGIQALTEGQKKIMATEQQITDALTKIDAATTKIAGNVGTVATTLQTVSDEMDALEKALASAGVSDALVAQASSLGDRVQAASDALDAQVPVLQAIATKGAANPVPVPPPAPPPAA